MGLQTWVQALFGYPIPNIRTPNTSHSFPSPPPIQNLFCWHIRNFYERADSIRSRGFQVKSQHWRSALTLSVIVTFYYHFNLYDWVICKLLASLLRWWVVIDSKLVKGSWQRNQGHQGKQDMNEACCLYVAATLPRDISLVTLYLVCNVWFFRKLKYAIEDLSGVYLHEGISTLTSWKVLTKWWLAYRVRASSKMVAGVDDAHWFNVNQGLRNEGLHLDWLSDAPAHWGLFFILG